MTLLYLVSLIAILIQICSLTIAVAAGLYYLAELVEEYTVIAKKVITVEVLFVTTVYLLFVFSDNLPWSMVICGLLSQMLHAVILTDFPYVKLVSIQFIGAVVMLFINHYLAFSYFTQNFYSFSEVLGYFTVCLWIVPFAFFVSLNANDNVLPTVNERTTLLTDTDNDIVTNYFSRRKNIGLLSLFNYAKESILPHRIKKSF
ncbi:protein TEX261 [Sitodiplosis mosellana]|uniref:protein TEX261 n=1 Tax=Sitodiplosis mosellana TaxID=263140 RepID=UPI0024452A2D|nr:protein TEX261 [Sitodiplosis mosellana]